MTKLPRLTSDESAVRRGRALLGFMSEEEARTFLTGQAVEPFDRLRPVWQRARAAYEALPVHDEVPPKLRDLPANLESELNVVRSAPVFQQHFANRQCRFQSVEVDRLVAFQQFVDGEFSCELANTHLQSGGLRDKVRFCLPHDFTADFSVGGEAVPGTFSVNLSSLSRNVSVGGVNVEQVPNQPLKVSFAVVVGANWVQVIEFEERYFLKNGYHRVWALRKRGDQFVPAIVTKALSFDDIGAGPGFFPQALILSDRPPLFRHFFDDTLAPELKLKSTMKVIRLTAQEFVLPRLP